MRVPISFAKLAASYPDKTEWPTKKLLDDIGGQVRETVKDADNTCAVRLSYALNTSGSPVHKVGGGLLFLTGKAHPADAPSTHGRHAHPKTVQDLFLIRVADVKTYLTKRYGAGTLIYDGHHPDEFKPSISGVTQGIIVFEWRGRFMEFGATGHADLFRIVMSPGTPPTLTPGCVGHCYFNPGPMLAYLWETNP